MHGYEDNSSKFAGELFDLDDPNSFLPSNATPPTEAMPALEKDLNSFLPSNAKLFIEAMQVSASVPNEKKADPNVILLVMKLMRNFNISFDEGILLLSLQKLKNLEVKDVKFMRDSMHDLGIDFTQTSSTSLTSNPESNRKAIEDLIKMAESFNYLTTIISRNLHNFKSSYHNKEYTLLALSNVNMSAENMDLTTNIFHALGFSHMANIRQNTAIRTSLYQDLPPDALIWKAQGLSIEHVSYFILNVEEKRKELSKPLKVVQNQETQFSR